MRGGKCPSGADNEIWSYGEEIYEICRRYILLREKMRPYLRRVMQDAHQSGDPVMRPLFYGYPGDPKAWEIDDEYLFGPDLLVAPILYEGQRERTLYLPAGTWRILGSGRVYQGGQTVTVPAPIDIIPVFAGEGTRPELF